MGNRTFTKCLSNTPQITEQLQRQKKIENDLAVLFYSSGTF